jgi:hypothetical protein
MTNGEKDALRLEIKARKELYKRLSYPKRLLDEAAAKERKKREERVNAVREYKSFEELQEAYGYDLISEEEFREGEKALELGAQYVENTKSATEIAANMLFEFMGRLLREQQGFEFELLPAQEQDRILRQRDELLARRKSARDIEDAAPYGKGAERDGNAT